jgi:hypothetical protein
MPRLVPATLALAAFWVSACGSGDPGAIGASTSAADEPARTVSTQGPEQLYEVDAIVLESERHGPMLCLGLMLTSLPPQCGTVPLVNWDWDAVGGEERLDGTTWGAYHVVGTFDGETVTVARTGLYEEETWRPEPVYESPCREPEGGWVADPGRHSQNDDSRADAYARSQPDYVTSFVDHLDEEPTEWSPVVFVAVFTGDSEGHEAEIRKVWSGPLCVVERDAMTDRELHRIRREAEASLLEFGLQMVGSSTEGVPPRVVIEVVADPGGAGQAAFDARFGPGILQLIPALRLVD